MDYATIRLYSALLGIGAVLLAMAWAGYFEPRVRKIINSKINGLRDEQEENLDKSQEAQKELLVETFYSKDDGIRMEGKVETLTEKVGDLAGSVTALTTATAGVSSRLDNIFKYIKKND